MYTTEMYEVKDRLSALFSSLLLAVCRSDDNDYSMMTS